MSTKSALIGKAGEMLVAVELMRRGIEVAHPAFDAGIDLLAYRLAPDQSVPSKVIPIQVKARATSGYHFQRRWFDKVAGVVLVHVWHLQTTPEYYVFESLTRVEEALGPTYAKSPSWQTQGRYNVTTASPAIHKRMQAHRDKWNRIIGQL